VSTVPEFFEAKTTASEFRTNNPYGAGPVNSVLSCFWQNVLAAIMFFLTAKADG